MTPYGFLLGIPAFIALLSPKFKIRNRRIENKTMVLFSFFFFLFFLLALRGAKCGNDTNGYLLSFHLARQTEWKNLWRSDFEFGYAVFEKICAVFSMSDPFFLGTTAFLSLFPIGVFYIKEVRLPYLAVVLFCTIAPFSMYFSGIRQSIAMAFAVPVWYCAKNRKFMLFVFTVAFAMLFHTSAGMLFFLYPLYHLHLTSRRLWMVIPAFLLVFIFNKQIFLFFARFLEEKYVHEVTDTGAYNVLALLIIFGIFSYAMPQEEDVDEDTRALRNILLFTIVLQCFAPVHVFAMRLNYYFLIFVPVLISRVISYYRGSYEKLATIALFVMVLFFTVYFFYNLSKGGGLHIYPYLPFWSSS